MTTSGDARPGPHAVYTGRATNCLGTPAVTCRAGGLALSRIPWTAEKSDHQPPACVVASGSGPVVKRLVR
jgi:hypothetical protein